MGQVTARLDRHDKAVRRLGPPPGECVRSGEPVERAVVLDRAIPDRVVLQPVALREARRVQHAPPVAVLPARGTDQNGHRRNPASFPRYSPMLPQRCGPSAAAGHGSRTAIPHTCGDAGKGTCVTGNLKASDSVTVKPARAMALSVSRLTWHPPTISGHTVASSTRWTRCKPGVSAWTCSMKRNWPPGRTTLCISRNAAR